MKVLTADEAIDAVMDRATEYATARFDEINLEDQRPIKKLAAIVRIMQSGENTLTGKPHSASSAESQVETDDAYAAHRRQQLDAAVTAILCRARYEAAKFRAQLACNLQEVEK